MTDQPTNPDPVLPALGTGSKNHTREEWQRRIIEDLGGNGVDPELSRQQVNRALDAAIELWNRFRPCKMWFPFVIPASATTVITFFSDEAHTSVASQSYVRSIIRVDFSDGDNLLIGPRAGFLEGYYLRWGFEGPRLYFEMQVAQRTYERLTGSRPDWQWNPADRKLYITNASRNLRIMALATRENTVETIPYDQVSLFQKAALAKAKYYLARTLGSKGPIKGSGGEIQTDAESLRSESKEEWDSVETELKASMMSVPSPYWIG